MDTEGAAEPVYVRTLYFRSQMFLSYILHYTVSECHWEQPVTNDKSDNDNWMIVKILNNQKYFDPLEKPQDF